MEINQRKIICLFKLDDSFVQKKKQAVLNNLFLFVRWRKT